MRNPHDGRGRTAAVGWNAGNLAAKIPHLPYLRDMGVVHGLAIFHAACVADWSRFLDLHRNLVHLSSAIEAESLPVFFPVARVLLSSVGGMMASFVRDVATRRMIRVAIAVELYRAEHGRVPNGLDEIADRVDANVCMDPFDSAPLRYREEEAGYTIYSIYANLKDDGGATREGGISRGDWVLRVVR